MTDMTDFLQYCQQAEADDQRTEPLIWQQQGDHVVDPLTGRRFTLAEALTAVTRTQVDYMGGGVMVWFGKANVRIQFGATGTA